ncbi:MAG TPA: serine hydrolase domain-containing protein, partial [Chitinophagaceae bacterium]|nr:serine hydrolase domain-containing protein [Chitinophagaceae bacterium]
MKKSILSLVVLASCILIANAQSWQDTVNSIEKLFERYKPGIPGAQLAISRNGQLIYSKAWGMADLEHNAPLTTNSVAEAGSVSKQFTAAAILLLEKEGKLSLDDDVRKYLPELPNYGNVITLRHMMQHTSGIKDWGSIAALAGWPRSTKTYSNDDALYIISRQQTLNNKPGDEFIYSNSNYNLFAIIVQRVSGMSLAEYTKKNIFEPAGMTHTQWRDDYKRVVPNRAMAYGKSDKYYTNMPNEYVYGNGGLLTTAEDLLAWVNYYSSGKLGLLQKQITPSAFNRGVMGQYAAGLFITKYEGVDIITHDGATASYRASLDYFPTLGLSIAWLSNSSEFDRSFNTPDAVRKLFIKGKSPEAHDEAVFNVPEEKLKIYASWYRSKRSGAGVRLYMKDGKLQSPQISRMVPTGENTFSSPAGKLIILPNNAGFMLIGNLQDSIYFSRVDSVPANANMNEYAGEYYSDEAQATYSI